MITKLHAITVWFHQCEWLWCENCQKCRQMLERKLFCQCGHCVAHKPQGHERQLYYFMQWFIAYCEHEYRDAARKRKRKNRPRKQVLCEGKKLMWTFAHNELHLKKMKFKSLAWPMHWFIGSSLAVLEWLLVPEKKIDRNESIWVSE